jgi:hypothetical protein
VLGTCTLREVLPISGNRMQKHFLTHTLTFRTLASPHRLHNQQAVSRLSSLSFSPSSFLTIAAFLIMRSVLSPVTELPTLAEVTHHRLIKKPLDYAPFWWIFTTSINTASHKKEVCLGRPRFVSLKNVKVFEMG